MALLSAEEVTPTIPRRDPTPRALFPRRPQPARARTVRGKRAASEHQFRSNPTAPTRGPDWGSASAG